MPESTYEEFLEAQGSPSESAQEQQNMPSSEEVFPEDNNGGKGEEI